MPQGMVEVSPPTHTRGRSNSVAGRSRDVPPMSGVKGACVPGKVRLLLVLIFLPLGGRLYVL